MEHVEDSKDWHDAVDKKLCAVDECLKDLGIAHVKERDVTRERLYCLECLFVKISDHLEREEKVHRYRSKMKSLHH